MGLLNLVLVSTANLVFFYNFGNNIVPYSVVFISLLSSFLFLFNYRLLVKYIFAYYRNVIIKRARVMIFGAGQTGIITRHVIESTPRMQVVGFLEDDQNKVGKILNGARIYSAKRDDIDMLFAEMNVDELVFTAKDVSLDRKNEMVDICIRNQVKVRTIPPVEKWVRGELSFNQIKEINIEDLLGRESIKLNNENVKDLRGKKILITGAAGSIGMELVRQVIPYTPDCIVLIDQSESALYELEREIKSLSGPVHFVSYLADITNRDRMAAIFGEHHPELVYHAAAYKHVPMMESNPSEAITGNVLRTHELPDLP